MPWQTECNQSIWQWPKYSCVQESQNQLQYSFDDINCKDPYRDMVCFFSQDQHLLLNVFVTLNQSDVSKYVQRGNWLTEMCKEEQMQ